MLQSRLCVLSISVVALLFASSCSEANSKKEEETKQGHTGSTHIDNSSYNLNGFVSNPDTEKALDNYCTGQVACDTEGNAKKEECVDIFKNHFLNLTGSGCSKEDLNKVANCFMRYTDCNQESNIEKADHCSRNEVSSSCNLTNIR